MFASTFTLWNFRRTGERRSCMPTSMPSTRRSSNCWTLPYGNRPIAVGGSVVLAASYEARSYGVRVRHAGWRARQLCGDLLFVGGHFSRYQQFGDDVVSVFHDFTLVERVSIDEAFLDVAGAVHSSGRRPRSPLPSADACATKSVCPCRLAWPAPSISPRSHHRWPNPTVWSRWRPRTRATFSTPFRSGCYGASDPRRNVASTSAGIYTIGQLAKVGSPILGRLARSGRRDETCRPLGQRRPAGSQPRGGRSPWAPRPRSDGGMPRRNSFERRSAYLTDRVTGRLRKANLAGRRVTVRVRFPQMRSATRSATLRLRSRPR